MIAPRLKTVVAGLLIAFAAGSALYMAGRNTFVRTTPAVDPGGNAQSTNAADILVYYFSQGKDCATCDRIESLTLETIETRFPNERALGAIAWQSLDLARPENTHYIVDYSLYTKSVVVVDIENGRQVRWKNLDAVWEKIYNEPAFMDYIESEIRSYLDAPA